MSNLAAAPAPDFHQGLEHYLNLKEKAAQLGVSVSHLRRLVAAGVVQAVDLSIPGTKRRVLRFKP